jgi:hypothetical protein
LAPPELIAYTNAGVVEIIELELDERHELAGTLELLLDTIAIELDEIELGANELGATELLGIELGELELAGTELGATLDLTDDAAPPAHTVPLMVGRSAVAPFLLP